MDIAEKTLELKRDFDEVYAAGMSAEQRRFFKSYQRSGNRADCNDMFAEWTTDIFTPLYDIRPTGRANNIFYNSYIEGDLREILENYVVELDFSKCKSVSYAFKYSNFTALPVLDFSNVKEKSYHVCQYCDRLKTIDKIIITYGNQTNILLNHAFDGCVELVDVVFEMTDKTDDNGIIQDVGFPDSPLLSKNTIENVLSLVHPLRSITITFSEQAILNAYGSLDDSEWISLIESVPKATIALV